MIHSPYRLHGNRAVDGGAVDGALVECRKLHVRQIAGELVGLRDVGILGHGHHDGVGL